MCEMFQAWLMPGNDLRLKEQPQLRNQLKIQKMYCVISLTLNISFILPIAICQRRRKKPFLILGVFYVILGVCDYPQKRINLHYLLLTVEFINILVIEHCKNCNRTFHVCGTDIRLYFCVGQVHVDVSQNHFCVRNRQTEAGYTTSVFFCSQ